MAETSSAETINSPPGLTLNPTDGCMKVEPCFGNAFAPGYVYPVKNGFINFTDANHLPERSRTHDGQVSREVLAVGSEQALEIGCMVANIEEALIFMNQKKLKEEARKLKIEDVEEKLDKCYDADDTKAAMIELILNAMTQNKLQDEARRLNITEEKIEGCEEEADAKAAMIKMILTTMKQKQPSDVRKLPIIQQERSILTPVITPEEVAYISLAQMSLAQEVAYISFNQPRADEVAAKYRHHADQWLTELQIIQEAEDMLQRHLEISGWKKRLQEKACTSKKLNKIESYKRRIRNSHHLSSERKRWTTLYLQDIPNNVTREGLGLILDTKFQGLYDFLYMPWDFKKNSNYGFAFVNFRDPDDANRCFDFFDGFKTWGKTSDKVGDSGWAKEESQGKEANVEQYRNSDIMHPAVPDRFKPIVLDENGEIVKDGIPPPNKGKRLKKPKELPDNLKATNRCSSCKEEIENDCPRYLGVAAIEAQSNEGASVVGRPPLPPGLSLPLLCAACSDDVQQ